MKRSVFVAAGTAVGLTAVVSYHVATPSSLTSLAAAAPPSTSSSKTTAQKTGAHKVGSGVRAPQTSTTQTSTTAGNSRSSGVRSALGKLENFPYGELQVKVTEHGGRVTDVSIARFGVPEAQSQSIDQIAVPQLRQQVLAAQSAHINGVSGASYTSQAYALSVQAALDKLG